MKSVTLYALFMWHLLKYRYKRKNLECHYFSYKGNMASYHVGSPKNEDNIKRLININPFYEDVSDTKDQAESVAIYTWDGQHTISLTAHGLLTFTRGTHTRGLVFIDDPLQTEDPTTKIEPARVRTVNNRVMSTIYQMPQFERGAQLHIVGTPQTEEDFFYDPDFQSKFAFREQPAEVNTEKRIALFPEFRSWEWLKDKEDTLPRKIYEQEYLCKPSYSTDTYLEAAELKALINIQLPNFANKNSFKIGKGHDVVGGYDIGKHRHPSHLSIFQITEKGKHIQRVSKWIDNMGYAEQIETLRDIINRLGVKMLYYDSSRGEFESMQETGKLPDVMFPINLTVRKKRFDIAGALSKLIETKQVEFIDDQRQYRQMLVVDSDLKARETAEGHGDSFWSNACAMEAQFKEDAAIMFA